MIKFHPCACTVNWFNEHLYSKLVLCIMSIPCTFFSLLMSVPVHSQCIHVLKSGYIPMRNVCPLYILLNCNVCSLYILLTCNVCPLYIPLTCTCAHKTSLQYRSTQNQFTVQLYTNKFTVQVYIKPVSITDVQKSGLEYTF